MTQVKMKALDTLHVSSAGPDNIPPGGEFEVSSAVADDLEQRGLAKRADGTKAAPAHANKAEPEPANKADIPPLSALGIPAKQPSTKAPR